VPFASEPTKEWIRTEVMPSGGGGAGGGDQSEGSDAIAAARALAGSGKTDDAMAALLAVANGARSARARFRARLAMAQALSSGATAAAAEGIFDGLIADIDAMQLETWEPELAAECYRSHLNCLKSLKKGTDPVVSQQTTLIYRRYCRVDPLGAVKAGL
jgi:type VI secretion system protein VasJ